MSNNSNVEILFFDLSHKYQEILKEKQSPVNVRRLLGELISTSLRMTAQMRRTNEIGYKFNFENFTEWNEISSVFDKLRNYGHPSYSPKSSLHFF